jgi:Winged helix DNA-binding domain
LTCATDGNLGAHLDHLARAGYVQVTKAFVGRRPAPRSKPGRKGVRRSPATSDSWSRSLKAREGEVAAPLSPRDHTMIAMLESRPEVHKVITHRPPAE